MTQTSQAVHPGLTSAFAMHTLTVRGTNLAGKPDTGDDAFIANADNPYRLPGADGFNYFFRRAANFKVPVPSSLICAMAGLPHVRFRQFLRATSTVGSLRLGPVLT